MSPRQPKQTLGVGRVIICRDGLAELPSRITRQAPTHLSGIFIYLFYYYVGALFFTKSVFGMERENKINGGRFGF